MRSNLIAVLGVGMLLLIVFGVTVISQYAGGPASDVSKSDEPAAIAGVPLLFAKNEMSFAPGSEDLDKKYFQGFFEVTDQLLKVNFWFKNPHKQPVFFTVRGRSCSACTSANVAVVSAEEMKRFESQTALARFGVGVAPVPDLLTPLAHLALTNSLHWQPLDFEQPENGVTVPAAPDDDTPTWGIFQVVIKVSVVGYKKLSAEVGMAVGKSPTVRQVFSVATVGTAVLDVAPKKIEIGEFAEGSAPRVTDLYCWSAIREQDELPPPSVNVNVKDPFIRLGIPVPLTQSERDRIYAERLSAGAAQRVKGGYRIPVTVLRRVPAAEVAPGAPVQPDVGPYERQIGIATTGAAVLAVTVTANVTGVVGLVDGGVINLKDFNGRSGVERTVSIVSDRADLDLEVVREECVPKYVKITLAAPTTENGRKFWAVKIVVPADACQEDLPADSAVVLRGTTGGETIKVKLPVKGRGFVRGR